MQDDAPKKEKRPRPSRSQAAAACFGGLDECLKCGSQR